MAQAIRKTVGWYSSNTTMGAKCGDHDRRSGAELHWTGTCSGTGALGMEPAMRHRIHCSYPAIMGTNPAATDRVVLLAENKPIRKASSEKDFSESHVFDLRMLTLSYECILTKQAIS